MSGLRNRGPGLRSVPRRTEARRGVAGASGSAGLRSHYKVEDRSQGRWCSQVRRECWPGDGCTGLPVWKGERTHYLDVTKLHQLVVNSHGCYLILCRGS